MGIGSTDNSQKSVATAQRDVFTTNNFENYDLKAPDLLCGLIFLMSFACQSCVTRMCLYFIYMYMYGIHMSLVCTRMSSVYHSYVLVCDGMSLVCTRMSSVYHSYVLVCDGMSFVCSGMSSVFHSHLLVCYLYVTRMYSHVIRISLVCTCMSSVYHSYVLACYSYITRIYLYVICMSLVCTCMSSVCH